MIVPYMPGYQTVGDNLLIPYPPNLDAVLVHMESELQFFCACNRLPYLSADEVLHEVLARGEDFKCSARDLGIIRQWIEDFIERWDQIQAMADYQNLKRKEWT